MKYLIPIVFALLAFNLSYKESPRGVYSTVKTQLEENNVEISEQWSEIIRSHPMRRGLYAVSLDMGALGGEFAVHILVNQQKWRTLTHHQKKILMLHEMLHSLFEVKHDYYDQRSIMSSGKITKWDNYTFDEVLQYEIKKFKLTHR